MRVHILTGLALAAFLTACASAAEARPAVCLWEHLPQPQRNAVIAAGMQGGPQAGERAITDDDRKAAREACGYGASPDLAVSAAWAGVIFQKLAELWLAQNAELPASQLDAAWKASDPAVIAKLSALTRAQQPAPPELIDGARATFAAGLGLDKVPDPQISDKFLVYMNGRTLQAIYEPQL
jgi:hypothetical protein